MDVKPGLILGLLRTPAYLINPGRNLKLLTGTKNQTKQRTANGKVRQGIDQSHLCINKRSLKSDFLNIDYRFISSIHKDFLALFSFELETP